MMNHNFVHLRVHSEYSLLNGACRIEDIVNRAKELGMTSIALTDHSALYGAISFYKLCVNNGLKPILGVELTIGHNLVVKPSKGESIGFQIVLLAETLFGYKNLLKIVSEAQLGTSSLATPLVNKEILAKYSAGIIAIIPAREGEVQRFIEDRNNERAKEAMHEYLHIFGTRNLFLELTYHGLEEEMLLNQRLLRFAEEQGVELVATNDVYYINKEDSAVHEVLRCIGSGTQLTDPNRSRLPSDQYYLKSAEEMVRLFPYAVSAVRNTIEIAERCNVQLSFGEHILPKYPVPGEETAVSYLRSLCFEGLQKRYPEPTVEAMERLEYELTVIEKMGFSDYFLIVWDFMRFAHGRNILTGPGRGSAAGSLVAYTLSITNIDPLYYKLLFERFLNHERISMPDIDIDFEVERRNEVIRYVTDKYGRDHVAQIITFGTMAARAAIRDIGRVLNYPPKMIDSTAKLISSGATIAEALEQSSELKRIYEENESVQHLVDLSRKIEGFPRHVSTHAAGVVISRDPLTNYVPLQQGNEGFSLTQFAMEGLEEIGLLKMDFLGLRNLTILDGTIRLIQSEQGKVVELDQIPHDDRLAFNLLSKGDTTGIFQLESAGMRKVLREVVPTHFEDIIAILALYRPGPMEIIPQYAATKNGRQSISYIHPDLEPILSDTYGFIIYQEQIMQIAAKMAGYSLGQADVLRRAVSKKKREILEQERMSFVDGCKTKGYSLDLANELYDLIVRFADYGYNRSHSAAYSLIAYQMAYLKAHYSLEFMTVLLSMSIGSTDKIAEYVEESRKLKIPLLLPNINQSFEGFSIKDRKILFGLSAIKHVGAHVIRVILEERKKNGFFKDLFDFCRRIDLRICNRRVIEVLIQCGSLDSLPGHRVQKLSVLDDAMEKGLIWKKEHESGQVSLFDQDRTTLDLGVDSYPEIPPFTAKENLELEKELLGLYVSGHPLDEFDYILRRKEVTPISELTSASKIEMILSAGVLVEVKTITTKKGESMAFATLEDKLGQAELVFFPNVYNRYLSLIKKDKKLVVQGKVEQASEGKAKIIVQKLWDMTTLPKEEHQQPVLFIRIGERMEHSQQLHEIQKLLVRHSGTVPVCLYYEKRKETKRLQDKYRVTVDESLKTALENIVGKDSINIKYMNVQS
ncbi:MAG TPA: DNA polymerase III subunit alpha [Bacillota bacterium]|nr:DNA polymerase III subunit alpha [Bacillota bacterium]